MSVFVQYQSFFYFSISILGLLFSGLFLSGLFYDSLSNITYRLNGDRIPEPVSWRFLVSHSVKDVLLLLIATSLLRKGTQFLGPIQLSSDLLTTLFQAGAGILAITISALLLLTQLSSEKYSSVTVYRFQSHGTIQAILKFQIISLVLVGVILCTTFAGENGKIDVADSNVAALGILLSFISIILLPSFLAITILQLRPRGLIRWSVNLANEKISALPKYTSKKNKKRLLWEMVILHECFQGLHSIGCCAVKDQDDEIVTRVLMGFSSILEKYYAQISNHRGGSDEERSYRMYWDAELAERLLFSHDNDAFGPGYSENQDTLWMFWIENNILRSVAAMLETSAETGGESNQQILEFYQRWCQLMWRHPKNAGVEYHVILNMLCSDFLVTYKNATKDLSEISQIELIDFFKKRIESFTEVSFDNANTEMVMEPQLRQITLFLRQVGEVTIHSKSNTSLQRWLALVEQIRSHISVLDQHKIISKQIESSFARVYFDLFICSLLLKSHSSTKVILQHICFNQPPDFIDEVFKQAIGVLNSAASGSIKKAPDNMHVRYDKFLYTVTKCLFMVLSYRKYIEDESLVHSVINGENPIKMLIASKAFQDIKAYSIPHLKTELPFFMVERLNLGPKGPIDDSIAKFWPSLDKDTPQ